MPKQVIKCPKCGDTRGLEQVHKFADNSIHEIFCNTCGQISLLDLTKEENEQYFSDEMEF